MRVAHGPPFIGGVPALAGSWYFDRTAKELVVELTQAQSGEPYRLPLEVGISMPAAAAPRVERLEMTDRKGRFAFPVDSEPTEVTLDPGTWMLMETPSFTRRDR